MKKFHFRREFGAIDLTDIDTIAEISDKLSMDANTTVVLDFTGCLLGYETCALIDRVIYLCSKCGEWKTVMVVIDYSFVTQDALIDWLFRDSSSIEWSSIQSSQDSDRFSSLVDYIYKKHKIVLKLVSASHG